MVGSVVKKGGRGGWRRGGATGKGEIRAAALVVRGSGWMVGEVGEVCSPLPNAEPPGRQWCRQLLRLFGHPKRLSFSMK